MVKIYAEKLQSCETKYIMQYLSEVIKKAIQKNLFTLENLYTKKEKEIINIIDKNFSSWKAFCEETSIKRTNEKPNYFYASSETKKRNVIPLIKIENKFIRINEVSNKAKQIYLELSNYQDSKYAYIENIKEI